MSSSLMQGIDSSLTAARAHMCERLIGGTVFVDVVRWWPGRTLVSRLEKCSARWMLKLEQLIGEREHMLETVAVG